MHGTFVWNELMTGDIEKAKAFYATAMGWTYKRFEASPGMEYWVASVGDRMVGGIMGNGMAPPGTPPHWLSYLEVDDVNARVAAAKAAGATILQEPFDVPTVGRIAIVKDPTGAVMGWITSQMKS